MEQLQQQAEQYHNRAEKYAVLGVTREVEHMAGKAASYEHAIEIVKAECKIEAQARETTESKDPVWENSWTLCSERLPNEEEFIKAYRRNKYAAEFIVMIKGASRPTTLYFTHGGWWTDNMIDRYDVVAWMPLPEPLGVRE